MRTLGFPGTPVVVTEARAVVRRGQRVRVFAGMVALGAAVLAGSAAGYLLGGGGFFLAVMFVPVVVYTVYIELMAPGVEVTADAHAILHAWEASRAEWATRVLSDLSEAAKETAAWSQLTLECGEFQRDVEQRAG